MKTVNRVMCQCTYESFMQSTSPTRNPFAISLSSASVFRSVIVTVQVCEYTVSVSAGPEFMATWTKLAVFLGFVPELGAVKLRL